MGDNPFVPLTSLLPEREKGRVGDGGLSVMIYAKLSNGGRLSF